MPRGARLVLLASIVLLLMTFVPALPAGAAAPPMGSDLLRGRAMDPGGRGTRKPAAVLAIRGIGSRFGRHPRGGAGRS